jgi:acetamidase/formamidase
MLHSLRATPKTVHWGYFDASLAPVLRVKSGDLVQIEAVTHHVGDAPDLLMDPEIERLYREIPEADRNPGVHIMTGPIFIEDARPGDMLEVRYLQMTPRIPYGSNLAANWGALFSVGDPHILMAKSAGRRSSRRSTSCSKWCCARTLRFLRHCSKRRPSGSCTASISI